MKQVLRYKHKRETYRQPTDGLEEKFHYQIIHFFSGYFDINLVIDRIMFKIQTFP